MKTTGIGDMILLTAIAHDVIQAFPGAEVVILCGAENIDVAALVGGARVVALPTAQPWRALPLIRAERLDFLIDFGQWTKLEAVYTALSAARWTAGFATPGQRRHFAYDAVVPHSNEVHELENYRRLVGELGVRSCADPSFRPSADGPPPPSDDPYVVFHLWPGGFRSELREWPAASWRELAERFVRDEYSVFLTGGPGDASRTEAFLASCGELSRRMVSLAGRFRVSQLINTLAAARCVVSVNTGVMHLAAAVGVPTIGLNGPTASRRWGPIGRRAVSIDSELPGCGYLDLGFEYVGRRTDCMSGITVDRVVEVALEHTRD